MSQGRMRRIYPPREPLVFDGGLNNKFQRTLIEENESPDCLNVVYEDGSVGTREGCSLLNSLSVGSFVNDGIYTRRANDGSESMVGFWGGTGYVWNGSSFATIPSAQSVFTASVRVAGVNYENHLFLGNGGVEPYKYNGTDYTRHGVPAPTTTMTAATASTGSALTGDYRYGVTYVNSALAESDISPLTSTFTAAGENVALTGIPTGTQSFGVASRRLYRTEAGGSTFKRLASISDNTTTTYEDGIADGSLGVTAPTDNGVPPKYNAILYHQDRLFMNDPSNPNYAWWTNLGEPYTVASTNFMKLGDAAGDLVKGFGVFQDSVVVFCEKSIWLIYMPDTDPANWQRIKIRSPYGSKSPFGTFNFLNKLGFPAMENDKFVGIGAVSGLALEHTATNLPASTAGSDLISQPIEPDMFLVQETYVSNISAIAFKNKAYISLTYGSGSTTNNRIYVYDFSVSNLRRKRPAWSPFTGWNASQFTIYDGKLYYAESTDSGYVYQAFDGSYSDNGSAIDSYAWTKEYAGIKGEENFQKDWRFANLLVDKAGSYYMNVTYRTDSDAGDGTTDTISLDPGGSLWGSMEWGTDVWGGGTEQEEVKFYLGTARGKRIQFKFDNQNTAGQRFKVHWMTLPYNLKGFR